MAFTWKEKYATIIDSSTWSQSIEGYKITNVFGLAWNYYIAYTKFITGLDITLDMGLKCELFFAKTYKFGYADTVDFGATKSTDLTKLYTQFKESFQSMCTSHEEVVEDRVSSAESVDEDIEIRVSVVGDDSIDRMSFYSCTDGDEVLVAGTVSQTADSIEVTAALEHIITTALFNVNDSLEVL